MRLRINFQLQEYSKTSKNLPKLLIAKLLDEFLKDKTAKKVTQMALMTHIMLSFDLNTQRILQLGKIHESFEIFAPIG